MVTRDAEFRSPSSHPNTPLGQPSFFNLTPPNFKPGHKQTGKNTHVMVLIQPPESAAVGTGCLLCTGLSQAVKHCTEAAKIPLKLAQDGSWAAWQQDKPPGTYVFICRQVGGD